jgi:hypothetical protein
VFRLAADGDNGRNLDSAMLFVPTPPAVTTAGGI